MGDRFGYIRTDAGYAVHGKLEFLQLVGITAQEAAAIQADYHNLNVLLDRMRADNPELVTDMHRTHSYL